MFPMENLCLFWLRIDMKFSCNLLFGLDISKPGLFLVLNPSFFTPTEAFFVSCGLNLKCVPIQDFCLKEDKILITFRLVVDKAGGLRVPHRVCMGTHFRFRSLETKNQSTSDHKNACA